MKPKRDEKRNTKDEDEKRTYQRPTHSVDLAYISRLLHAFVGSGICSARIRRSLEFLCWSQANCSAWYPSQLPFFFFLFPPFLFTFPLFCPFCQHKKNFDDNNLRNLRREKGKKIKNKTYILLSLEKRSFNFIFSNIKKKKPSGGGGGRGRGGFFFVYFFFLP